MKKQILCLLLAVLMLCSLMPLHVFAMETTTCDHIKVAEPNVEPTCTYDGFTGVEYCFDCGEILNYWEKLPAKGHKYSSGICERCGLCEDGNKIYGVCGENLRYVFDRENQILIISGTGEMTDYQKYISYDNGTPYQPDANPWIRERQGEHGFMIIQKIVVEEGVTSLGDYCFQGLDVQEIELPSTLTEIGKGAFLNCSMLFDVTVNRDNPMFCADDRGSLYSKDMTVLVAAAKDEEESFIIPEGVTTIGHGACSSMSFYERDLVFPKSLKQIDDYAFWNCFFDKEVYLPNGLEKIGDSAFESCWYEKILVPASVKEIGKSAFYLSGKTYVDDNNPYYCSNDYGVLYNKDMSRLIQAPYELTGCYEIPDGVTHIGEHAFDNCRIEEVSIPDSVVSIGECAFIYSYVKKFELSENVVEIGNDAFAYSAENGIWVDKANSNYCSDNYGVLYTYDLTRLIAGAKNIDDRYMIPYGVKAIDANAFAYLHGGNGIKSIVIPETLTEIGAGAFWLCTIPDVYYCGGRDQYQYLYELLNPSGLIDDWLYGMDIHYDYECEHSVVELEEINPTCTDTGLTEGAYCSICYEPLIEQKEIPAKGHSFSKGKCTVCGAEDPDYVAPTPVPTPAPTPVVTPAPTPAPVENPFTDVADDAWYAAPVLWAKANNVTGGTSETTFGPDAGCTRAQVVTFLWAANGKPEPKSENPFTDVADDAWYLKPVLWAVENGITTGVTATEFGPDRTCTRAQIATFLYAAAGKPEVEGSSSFADVKDADWFAKPIIWAAENEVTGGIGEGKFGPNNTCTRAQVVTFLYKVCGNK